MPRKPRFFLPNIPVHVVISPVGWVEERNPTNPYTTVDQTMQYRRATIPGACYFFTVNIVERNKSLLIDHIDELQGDFDDCFGGEV